MSKKGKIELSMVTNLLIPFLKIEQLNMAKGSAVLISKISGLFI
jgi:hypothetical protein